MDLGTGILLSSIFLGFVWLFLKTRKEWNWRKIFFISISAIVICIIAVVSYVFIDSYLANRAKKLEILSSVSLGMDKSEVIFLKGNPIKFSNNIADYQESTGRLQISYKNDKVVLITQTPNYSWLNVQGISKDDSSEDIISKLGQGEITKLGNEGIARLYSYPQYNSLYILEQNKVVQFGIYDPSANKEMKFGKSELN